MIFTRCIRLFMLAVAVLGQSVIFGADQQIIQEIKDEFAQQYNAQDPDPAIKNIAEDALAKCGINRPIIVMQSNTTDNAYTVSRPWRHPQEFMIIGIKGQTLDAIEGNIYHEIGHLAHGDMSLQKKLKDALYNYGAIASSIGLSLASGFGFQKYIAKNRFLASVVGGFSLLTNFCAAAFYKQHKESIKEKKADAYAYKKLIEHGKLNTALGYLADFISGHEYYEFGLKKSQLPAFLTGYPTDLERARMGLDILQEKGFNIAGLMKNLPPELDEGLKQILPGKIKEYFPEKF